MIIIIEYLHFFIFILEISEYIWMHHIKNEFNTGPWPMIWSDLTGSD